MDVSTAAKVEALARPQAGLVTRAQLLAAGLDRGLPAREQAAGRWQRLGSGLYLTAAGPPAPAQRLRAGLLLAGPGAQLCGPTAARLWGLRDAPVAEEVHVLLPESRRRVEAPGVVVHRSRDVPPPWTVGGLPVVALARAAVEAARWAGGLRAARAVLAAAVADGRCAPDELEDWLARGGQQGSRDARRALADARAGAASAPEAEVADLLAPLAARGRLPRFLLNPDLHVEGVRLGRPDLWLPGTGVGHETDSVRHHGDADALDATLDRHARFAAAGVALLHTSPRRARSEPAALVRRVLDAVERATGDPPGLTVTPRGPLLPLLPYRAPRA